MFSEPQKQLFAKVRAAAEREKLALYLVGGTIRDLIIGALPDDRDIDFIVEGDALAFAQKLSQELGAKLQLFPQFGTAKLSELSGFGGIDEIDLAGARSEEYPQPGSLPLVAPAEIAADLHRRDFSINAMGISLADFVGWITGPTSTIESLRPLLIDSFSGYSDLASRRIRILHPRSFIDDPTRIFRACRYAARISGVIEDATLGCLREALATEALNTVSAFRKLSEVRKICAERSPSATIRLLAEYGVWQKVALFDPSSSEGVLAALDRLEKLVPVEHAEQRYQVALRIFFLSFPLGQAEKVFRGYSFGRKFFRLVEAEGEYPQNPETYSTEGLLTQLAIGCGSAELLLAELRKREGVAVGR